MDSLNNPSNLSSLSLYMIGNKFKEGENEATLAIILNGLKKLDKLKAL